MKFTSSELQDELIVSARNNLSNIGLYRLDYEGILKINKVITSLMIPCGATLWPSALEYRSNPLPVWLAYAAVERDAVSL